MGGGTTRCNRPGHRRSPSRLPIRRSASLPGSWKNFRRGPPIPPSCPEQAIDRDHLLTNVMLYWLTGTAASSSRIYYENTHGPFFQSMQQRSETPVGVAVFDGDVSIRRFAESTNTIVRWTDFDRGGISPPWKSRNCSPEISALFSDCFGRGEQAAGIAASAARERSWALRAIRPHLRERSRP